jgi:hypothetical protein
MILTSSVQQSAVPCSLAATHVHTNAANVAHVKGSRSSRRITAPVNSSADAISRIAGILAQPHVMAKKYARFVTRLATSSAVTRNAPKDAASHALHAPRKNAHLVARTPNATCLVPLRAIGYLARSVAQSYWSVAINAHLCAAQSAQTKSTVKSVALTLSKTFVLTLSCLLHMPRSISRRAPASSCLVVTSSQLKV